MLDVAGTNADEFFEDIGHSKDAREELAKYLIGSYKMDEATMRKLKEEAEAKAKAGSGPNVALLLVVLVALAAIAYGYMQK